MLLLLLVDYFLIPIIPINVNYRFLKQLQLLNRLINLYLFATFKNLHISKLLVRDPENTDLTEWGHPFLDTCYMNICVLRTRAVTQINTELKHSEPVHQKLFAEQGILLPVFLGICRKVKENQHPHNSIFTKSGHVLAAKARLTMFLGAKLHKNTQITKFFADIFAYFIKKQYLCTTFLNDIHNKDYSDV